MQTQDETSKASGSKRKAEWFELDDSQNPYVYVSGLPLDITEEEFLDLMKKYGIVAKKSVPGNPFNIKMYKDKEGNFKGDALCRFARVESVELAITHLDGYLYDPEHTLRCERAKFDMKGEYDSSKKPRTLDSKSKIKQKKKVAELLSWNEKEKPEVKQKKVILKNMFSVQEMQEDASLILDIKEDIEDECKQRICEPKKVEVFDRHPEGVVAVTFAEPEQAELCVRIMNGRTFDNRKVVAEIWDGKTKYKIKETDEESEKRLQKWHNDIQRPDAGDDDK